MGAHTLGHVHREFSGYTGHPNVDPVTDPDALFNAWDTTPTVFDNDYYEILRRIVS